MEKTYNKKLSGILRRFTVVVPCIVIVLLFAYYLGRNETLYNSWTTQTKIRYWLSMLSGPFSTWIQVSWRTTFRQKAFTLVVAPAILLGILSHPIKPRKATGLVTILSTFLWFFWGLVMTYMGV